MLALPLASWPDMDEQQLVKLYMDLTGTADRERWRAMSL